MPIRDGKTPSGAELDQLAELTDEDKADIINSLKQRVPESGRAVEATRNDRAGGVKGPIPDQQ